MALDLFQVATTEMFLLLFLSDGDAHGYQLAQMLEEWSGGMFTVKAASLYPILYKLEANGFISSYQGFVERKSALRPGRSARVRVMYHMEPAGVERLAALRAEHEVLVKGSEAVFAYRKGGGDSDR